MGTAVARGVGERERGGSEGGRGREKKENQKKGQRERSLREEKQRREQAGEERRERGRDEKKLTRKQFEIISCSHCFQTSSSFQVHTPFLPQYRVWHTLASWTASGFDLPLLDAEKSSENAALREENAALKRELDGGDGDGSAKKKAVKSAKVDQVEDVTRGDTLPWCKASSN